MFTEKMRLFGCNKSPYVVTSNLKFQSERFYHKTNNISIFKTIETMSVVQGNFHITFHQDYTFLMNTRGKITLIHFEDL